MKAKENLIGKGIRINVNKLMESINTDIVVGVRRDIERGVNNIVWDGNGTWSNSGVWGIRSNIEGHIKGPEPGDFVKKLVDKILDVLPIDEEAERMIDKLVADSGMLEETIPLTKKYKD